MTALFDAMTDTSATPATEIPRTVDGRRWLARCGQRIVGAALVLAAIGLWVQPGALLDADLLLMKFALSLILGFLGLSVVQMGGSLPAVEIEIDTVRREVRLVRGKGRARQLVSRTRMADLGRAEQVGTMTRLWAEDGALIAEVALSDAALHTSLTHALQDAGKL
ncbi:hypothetical protein [Tateyamaria sp. SN3-11]|uniref:hypothetical protein n=1 Tax=Tateyamaria sp. SN3-11 TaxID=3092147 RepID=UPI0039EB6215